MNGWGWFVTGLLLGAAYGLWYRGARERYAKPIRLPRQPSARCAPEEPIRYAVATPPKLHVQVHGATETFSHPRADELILRGSWTTGGSA